MGYLGRQAELGGKAKVQGRLRRYLELLNTAQSRCIVNLMNAKLSKIRVFLLLGAATTASFGQGGSTLTNPSVSSPVGTGTVPVTMYRSGLVASPDPIDPTSNMVVTGNVGGGKYFRGVVPYNAISDFGGALGSGTLDSFLRMSTVPQNYYGGGIAPFYSQTGTVTRIVPGTNMVIVPPSSKIRTEQDESLRQRSILFSQTQANAAARSGSLGPAGVRLPPTSTEQVEPYLPLGIDQDQVQREKARERLRAQQKLLDERLKDAAEDVNGLEQLVGQRQTVKSSLKSGSEDSYSQLPQTPLEPASVLKPQRPQAPGPVSPQEQPQKIDVYEKMLAEYEQAKKAYEEHLDQSRRAEQQAEPDVNMPGRKPAARERQYEQPERITSTPAPVSEEQPAEKEPLSELEVLARTRRVLSERQTFAVYSQDKFNRHMRAAEEYMQQGKYYLAADAYRLASIYKPLDPLAYAGQSHALFAAGEYLSSALYLSRAIEMFNGYVDFKIDIVTMIGDMDTVEKRIADIKAWIELSSAPELEFLLAYVYMQLDRLDKASEAINAAYERMPDVPAVGLLRAAIERRQSQ